MTYDPNTLMPTRPLEMNNGNIVLGLYGQDDVMRTIEIADTKMNRCFAVWVRKFDRKGLKEKI